MDAWCRRLSSIAIGPGETAQPIHADDQLIPIPKPHVATVCNTMWALTDFTEENGATRLVPGSHTADHSPAYGESYDTIPAEMDAGSVLVWHGSLWHGGGANATDDRRVGIAMNYCAGWIRQQENQQLGIPRDIAAGFAPRLRELCGYGISAMTWFHSSSVYSATGFVGPLMPALLMATSRCPQPSTAAATAAANVVLDGHVGADVPRLAAESLAFGDGLAPPALVAIGDNDRGTTLGEDPRSRRGRARRRLL